MTSLSLKKLYNSKLIKSGLWYTVGNMFLQGISFLTLPIFTRLLTTSDYGVVSLYTTYISIFTFIVSLNVSASVSNAKYDFKENFNKFLSSILLLSSISFTVWILLALVFNYQFTRITGFSFNLIIIILVQSFFSYVIDLVTSKFTIEYKYKKYLLISIISTLLNVVLSIVFILNMKQNKYLGRIYGGFYVSLAFGIVMLIYIFVKGRTFIDKRYWKYSLLIALPLIPHNISGLVLAQFDRIIIGKYIGNSAAGIYSFAYNMGMILSVVWASLNKAWVPWFYEKMDSKSYEEIKEKYKYYLAFFSIITFILIYISPEIGKLMSSRSFWEGLRLVPIIMISYYFCFLYSLPANVEFYTKKTYYISAGTFAAGFVNIILNLLFIPRYGYSVGAWTTLISYVLLFIFHYIVSQKVFSTKLFEIKYFIYSISFIVCISLLFYVTMNFWLLRYIIVCFVVALVLTKLRKVSILFK